MKFIVYKASGGLAHMCSGLQYAIEYAKKNNRYLIVDCHKHMAFGYYKFSDFFKIDDNELNYGDDYSVIPGNYFYKNMSIKELEDASWTRKGSTYFINGNNITDVHKESIDNDVVVYCGSSSIRNYSIKVNDMIMKEISVHTKIKGKYIAVHFRNTDIKNDIGKTINFIKSAMRSQKINIVYLATDDYKAYDIIKESIEGINLIQYTKPDKNCDFGIHYGAKDKRKQIFNCLLDIYFILQSVVFIPCYSGLSNWINGMILEKRNMFAIQSNTKIMSIKN